VASLSGYASRACDDARRLRGESTALRLVTRRRLRQCERSLARLHRQDECEIVSPWSTLGWRLPARRLDDVLDVAGAR
jgi:hypothetical protein